MKGMRTKGADYETNFGKVESMEDVKLPLARMQDGFFERSSAVEKTAASEVIEIKPHYASREEYQELKDYLTEKTWDWQEQQTGEGELNKILVKAHYASRDEVQELKDYLTEKTWDWQEISGGSDTSATKKTAVIFDGYSHRVTIESKAGDNNETYSFITNLLAAADIRYREVRRYTVEPDRVMMDILIKKDDVEVIKEIDKEAKEYDVSFTFNDNISEGTQPKVIITPEKEMSTKVEASKKAAFNRNDSGKYFWIGVMLDTDTNKVLLLPFLSEGAVDDYSEKLNNVSDVTVFAIDDYGYVTLKEVEDYYKEHGQITILGDFRTPVEEVRKLLSDKTAESKKTAAMDSNLLEMLNKWQNKQNLFENIGVDDEAELNGDNLTWTQEGVPRSFLVKDGEIVEELTTSGEVEASKEVIAKSPPGWSSAVEKMKKDPDIDNPFAIAWDAHNKGHKAPSN